MLRKMDSYSRKLVFGGVGYSSYFHAFLAVEMSRFGGAANNAFDRTPESMAALRGPPLGGAGQGERYAYFVRVVTPNPQGDDT